MLEGQVAIVQAIACPKVQGVSDSKLYFHPQALIQMTNWFAATEVVMK